MDKVKSQSVLTIPHSRSTFDETDIAAVVGTLKRGLTTSGNLNEKFRNQIGKFLKKRHVALFSSGTCALYNALTAMGVARTADVLLPSYICSDVLRAVQLTGARAVFYDNAPGSWVAGYNEIRRSITRTAQAIILSHTFGIRTRELEKVYSIGIPIIEDCAHAFAPAINSRPIAKRCVCSIYSFNSTKCLATGEGGAVASNDRRFFERLRNNQLDDGLSDLACALGLSQLSRYDQFLARRKEIAEVYFAKLPTLSSALRAEDSLYFRFPILVKNLGAFAHSKILFRRGMDAILTQGRAARGPACPNAEFALEHTVCLPIYPSLSGVEMSSVVSTVLSVGVPYEKQGKR